MICLIWRFGGLVCCSWLLLARQLSSYLGYAPGMAAGGNSAFERHPPNKSLESCLWTLWFITCMNRKVKINQLLGTVEESLAPCAVWKKNRKKMAAPSPPGEDAPSLPRPCAVMLNHNPKSRSCSNEGPSCPNVGMCFGMVKWIGAIRDLSARFVWATSLLMDMKVIWLNPQYMREQQMLHDKNGIWQTGQNFHMTNWAKFPICAALCKPFLSKPPTIGFFLKKKNSSFCVIVMYCVLLFCCKKCF